jgi:hypothetical protein
MWKYIVPVLEWFLNSSISIGPPNNDKRRRGGAGVILDKVLVTRLCNNVSACTAFMSPVYDRRSLLHDFAHPQLQKRGAVIKNLSFLAS